ncbi:MAG: hypothetical protein JWP69_2414 [Flaviaesturariibacter sp.]|nr:hypothetical protein [Flaviaesturariibacter sp.]
MSKINLKVEMRSGTGFGVWVTVNDQSYNFTKSGARELTLTPQYYVATIGGQEPTSSTVTISFLQDEVELAHEEYKDPTFFGFIPFQVN